MTTTLLTPEELAEAHQASLDSGEGSGVTPGKVFGVRMKWRPDGGRLKTLFYWHHTNASAVAHYQAMKKYPVEGEEVTLLIGQVTWTEADLPE